jgi:hypothetical protein
VYDAGRASRFDLDEDGNVILAGVHLSFTATDDTGREAIMGILPESKELTGISTQHNDIIPGYSH